MTHFSKLTALFAISVAASMSATGCYAEVEDPTEENDVAVADESAVDNESLAVTDTDAEADADDEATAEDESALSAWGGYRYGGCYGGYGHLRRPYGYALGYRARRFHHYYGGYPRHFPRYPGFYARRHFLGRCGPGIWGGGAYW